LTDLVDALELIIQKGSDKNIYNVSTDEEYPIIKVTNMLCDTMEVSLSKVIEYVEDRPFNDPCYHSKNNKLLELGWKPKTKFHQLVGRMIEKDVSLLEDK
jgi:dTDP-D-glucose 4,6-dehydratase